MKNWLLLAVMIAAHVVAEPVDDTLHRLHGEQLSLLDLDIYQLEAELQSVRRNDKDFIRAYYAPQSKHNLIDAAFLVSQAEVDAITPRTACYVRHDEFPFVQAMRCDGLALSQEVTYHAPTSEDIIPR